MISGNDFLFDAIAGTLLGLIWLNYIHIRFKAHFRRWFLIRVLGKRGKAHERAEERLCHYLWKK